MLVSPCKISSPAAGLKAPANYGCQHAAWMCDVRNRARDLSAVLFKESFLLGRKSSTAWCFASLTCMTHLYALRLQSLTVARQELVQLARRAAVAVRKGHS